MGDVPWGFREGLKGVLSNSRGARVCGWGLKDVLSNGRGAKVCGWGLKDVLSNGRGALGIMGGT